MALSVLDSGECHHEGVDDCVCINFNINAIPLPTSFHAQRHWYGLWRHYLFYLHKYKFVYVFTFMCTNLLSLLLLCNTNICTYIHTFFRLLVGWFVCQVSRFIASSVVWWFLHIYYYFLLYSLVYTRNHLMKFKATILVSLCSGLTCNVKTAGLWGVVALWGQSKVRHKDCAYSCLHTNICMYICT